MPALPHLGDQQWNMDVPGTAEAVPLLRRWVRTLLVDDAGVADSVELIAGEYATNALWHSASGRPGGRITVGLSRHGDRVWLTVLDAGSTGRGAKGGPVREHPGDHGRGLMLVRAYAYDHGHLDTVRGRLAWAVVGP
ncbi:ATP-binding protein [Actinomadura parmotrematis]|uniref:ATP-binding protein n=1 Tax=Actinomadura parmotrematis TaxID=2864039 RepID=A0ABS7FUE7_9ACTN|nr:ATP-binding protein [Actinomadura parmotrematis]MBW8483946.1 ATP-binding protein [Actinomadura parmotrematis]